MASGTAIVFSDRMALEALIGVSPGAAVSGGGPDIFTMSLPVGFGDVLLIDCFAQISGVATIAPNMLAGAPYGATFQLQSGGGNRQMVGFGHAVVNYSDQVSVSPDKMMLPCLWRFEEVLYVSVPEFDTNASPTGVWNVFARVVRTRQ